MAISATQTDTLFIDIDDDGLIDPGDTVLTWVVISNSVGTDALNVVFNETLAGTTLVPNNVSG